MWCNCLDLGVPVGGRFDLFDLLSSRCLLAGKLVPLPRPVLLWMAPVYLFFFLFILNSARSGIHFNGVRRMARHTTKTTCVGGIIDLEEVANWLCLRMVFSLRGIT